MEGRSLLLFLVFLQFLLYTTVKSEELVSEEMLVSPLTADSLLVTWQFTLRSPLVENGHYKAFPKALGQLIRKYSVNEMHLTFTAGRWAEDWGPALFDSPVGAELWARFNASSATSSSLWQGLTHALSGVFCASLNFMDSGHTIQPSFSFPKSSKLSGQSLPLHYASLPREAVCTENLTPWSKFLPCRTQAGLASFIEPLHLTNSHFRSIQTHVFSTCAKGYSCEYTDIELVHSLTAVLPLPEFDKDIDGWKLEKLLGKKFEHPCGAVSSSKLYVNMGQGLWGVESVAPADTLNILPSPLKRGFYLSIYDTAEALKSDFIIKKHNNTPSLTSETRIDDISLHRYVSASPGWGQQEKLIVDIFNNGSVGIMARYIDSLPNFIKPLYHTLTIEPLGISPDFSRIQSHIVPGEAQKPASLQVHMHLPPGTGLSVSLEWQKVFLHYASYPPDPHRGFHIPSGLLVASLPRNDSERCAYDDEPALQLLSALVCGVPLHYRYTEALLLTLPTPDFSMPYNVITLTGAAIGLFFASIFKITTRRAKEFVDLPQPNTRQFLRWPSWLSRK